MQGFALNQSKVCSGAVAILAGFLGLPPISAHAEPFAAATASLERVEDGVWRLVVRPGSRSSAAGTITYDYLSPEITVNDEGRVGDLAPGDGLYSTLVKLTPAEAEQFRLRSAAMLVPANAQRESSAPPSLPRTLSRRDLADTVVEAKTLRALQPALQLAPQASPLDDDAFAERVLMVTNLNVIESPARVFDPQWPASNPDGVWSFKTLFERVAAAGVDSTGAELPGISTSAPTLVEEWLETFATSQTINGQTLPPRERARAYIDRWKQGGTTLDLQRAPFRLLGIFVRPDLVGGSPQFVRGNAGEARLVFGALLPPDYASLQFTVALEYAIQSTTGDGVRQWFEKWLELANYPAGSPEHLERLTALTEIFTRPSATGAGNALPVRSTLSQIRTNEIALGTLWQLREWILVGDAGRLRLKPVEVKQTPANRFNRTPALAAFIAANAEGLSRPQPAYQVPPQLADGTPFLAASSEVFVGNGTDPSVSFWTAEGVVAAKARQAFSMNTCNACHAPPETQTMFTHVGNEGRRELHERTLLSPLMLSSMSRPLTVPDPAGLLPESEKPVFRERTFRRQALEALGGSNLMQIFHRPAGSVH